MKFTVGLPITKTGHLQETLDSIEKQTFKDFEIVIKNNGADREKKDAIKVFLGDWLKKPNVRYYESEEQLSMTMNFNTVLEKAEGEYFVMMSDDDVMEADYLLEFNKLTEKYPEVNIFHCRVKRIDEKGNLIDFSELCPEFESQIDFVYHRIKGLRSLELSDYVLKTRAFKEAGGFTNLPRGWGTDEINWIKMAKKGLAFTPKILLEYRKFLGNFSLSKENLQGRFQDIDIMHNVIDNTIEEVCSNNQSFYPKDFLLNLSKERKQKQIENILVSLGKSSNNFEVLSFYFKNRDKLKTRAFFRAIFIKLGKKSKNTFK